jgi:hypothetical protein
MSDQSVSYPDDASEATFLLTVRGTMTSSTVAEARELHNQTAGDPHGVAAARSLGDLSHNVYSGYGEESAGELLFIDFWNSLRGLGQFFADPQVQAGASALFSTRDNPLWAAAADFGSFHLATPAGRSAAGIGLLRVEVTSLDEAAGAFRGYASTTINRARRSGLVSHSVWTRLPEPGVASTPEIIGVDVWLDPDEMSRYYETSLGFDQIGPAFAGKPDTSTWRAAPGSWVEW